jgi:quercetin dioxygenase-like cupin family protein
MSKMLMIAAAWGVLSAATVMQAADPVAVAPEIHRVVVDNPRVRILETRFVAGHTVSAHAHPARVVVVLSPSRVRIKMTDGKTEIVDRKAGEIYWAEPTEHSIEAIFGEVHEIETELKQPPPPSPAHSARDVPDLFPDLARIVFENSRVRVIDLRGEAGQRFPFHFHPARVMVRLGAGRLLSNMDSPERRHSPTSVRAMPPGRIPSSTPTWFCLVSFT